MNAETTQEKELDYTLRYLYDSLRKAGAFLLAIRFTHRGRRYEADRPEEAKRLADLLEAADQEKAKNDPSFARKLLFEKAGWTENRFWNLVNSIGEMQTKMLEALLRHEFLDDDELAKILGLRTLVSLAGVLSGFSKQAKRLGVRPSEVYQVTTYWKGRKKERMFSITEGFQEMAEEHQWPFISLLKPERSVDAPATTDKRK